MKPRNDFLEQMKRAQEAKAGSRPQPAPEPEPTPAPAEWEPETPEVAAELFKSQRDEARADLEREREKRQAAERRAQRIEEPQGSLGAVLNAKRRTRRRPWK